MTAGAAEKRLQAHTIKEHGKISENHGKRMPYRKISALLAFAGFFKLLFRHDRIRPDTGRKKLGVMIMMMIVGTFPDTGRRNHVNTKDGKQQLGQPGLLQDGMVLVIMKYNKYPGQHAGCKDAG